ncbi:MAG: RNA polymerase sigma factor [Alphaproteobacteria bacterium]|nr:RNA polymerase sigma factor [Alphaproteobacteria bacterium]
MHDQPVHTTDRARVAALLAGDADAFGDLVDEHHPTMLRVARWYVSNDQVAEEVTQETWLAILDGLATFEGRSSLKTWMFRILANRARTRAKREGRSVPMSALDGGNDEPLDADRFDERGFWRTPPERWSTDPESLTADRELASRVMSAIDDLPERQRTVLVLRDVEGWSSEEVRNALDLSETNQRVLLHRARAKVRAAIAPQLERVR